MTETASEPVATQVSRFVPAEKAARFEELLRDVITAAGGSRGTWAWTCRVQKAAASTGSSSGIADRPSTPPGSTPPLAAGSWRVSTRCSTTPAAQPLPGLDMVDGIADIGFALTAWIVDPDHNSIGLLQLKDSDR